MPYLSHVALLGDSVFDNAAYTGREPDVASHLRAALGPDHHVTLLAVDGSTTTDVGEQLDRIPNDGSCVVMSLGGNDALMSADLLDTPVRSTAEALDLFAARVDVFATDYGHVLDALAELHRRLILCTIYNGNLGPPEADRARMALTMFNDVILRGALRVGADLLELRAVCTVANDFANPIEPSGRGGAKIAGAIAAALSTPGPTRLFGLARDDAQRSG